MIWFVFLTVSSFMFYLKVGNVIVMLQSHLSSSLKSRTCELYGAEKKALEAARFVVTGIRQIGGMEMTKEVSKALYVKSKLKAKNLYDNYKHVAVEFSLLAWYKLCQVPVVPKVMEVLIRATPYCVQKKYNAGVHYLSDRVYWAVGYIPVVSVEKIKNTIYKELKMRNYTRSEIYEPSEIQVDNSTEH